MSRLRREHSGPRHFDVEPREVTLQCRGCEQDFVAVVTTKPKKYCASCRKIKAEEERVRSNAAKAKRDAPKLKPMPKLIPYAGYVEKENIAERREFYRNFRK